MRARLNQLAVEMKYWNMAVLATPSSRRSTGQSRRRWRRGDYHAGAAAEQHVELVEHADAAANGGGHGGARNPELRKKCQAVNEAGVQRHVDQVRHPQRPHGDGGVARTAEYAIDQEQKHDAGIAAEDHGSIARADADHARRGMHETEQLRREMGARDSHHDGHKHAEADSLDGGNGSAFVVLFADAAGHGGSGSHAQSERDAKNENHQGFGETHDGHGVGAQASHPESVDHPEGGFHGHFQNGGDSQQRDAAAEAPFGEILMRAGDGLANEFEFGSAGTLCTGFHKCPSGDMLRLH